MEDLSGVTLGPYRVESKLGQGGMGVVYRARDTRLDRDVALKVLPVEVAGDGERRARFLREAKSAAAVNHPSIATVHDVGESDGRVYIAMELVEGATLRARLARGPLPAEEALRVARAIAAGLARAHEKGIVHRDLKPENVMLAADGAVKILDFGLAKVHDAHPGDSSLAEQETQTLEGRVMGTPGYMSPEQASGRPVDRRTDVYALGVVLHEMLTGGLPGVGSGRRAIDDARIEAVVTRCLAPSPAERWHDAGGVLAALEAVGAPPRAPARRTGRIVGIAAIALVLAGGAGIAVREARRPTAAPHAAQAAPTATTYTDLPLPRSNVPEALVEYRAGMQLLRDDSSLAAHGHFARAAELDPSMVEAHLRAGMTAAWDPSEQRREIERATALRAQLSERDRALLDAVEPIDARTEPDAPETARRLRAALERWPADVELIDWLAGVVVGDPEQSEALSRRATTLDPQDAHAWDTLAEAAAERGDLEEARRAADRCVAISSESADCVGHQAMLAGEDGRCDDMARFARRQADLDPRMGHDNLRIALTALGRPETAVRAAFEAELAGQPASTRAIYGAAYDAMLAAFAGRFDRARDALDVWDRTIAGDPEMAGQRLARLWLLIWRAPLLRETGDDAGARAAAGALLDAQEAPRFVHAAGDSDEWPWWVLATAGRPLEPARSEWVQGELARGVRSPVPWTAAWAAPALGPEDARAALDALARDPRLSLPRGGSRLWTDLRADLETARVMVLGGRPQDALPYLRRQIASCYDRVLPWNWAESRMLLGQALEQTGDAKGACDAYGEVLSRWGHATPRSVSADAARAGVRRLHCEP